MENHIAAYDSICRVCLKQNNVKTMVSLQEKSGRRRLVTYGKLISRFAKISIDYEDVLPTKVCRKCKLMISDMHNFKLMCKNNDRKLRKLSDIADSDEKFKEMVCEFSIFSQYFPSSFRNTQSALLNSFEETSEKSFSPLPEIPDTNDIDNDDAYNILINENSENLNETEDVDLILKSIEEAIGQQQTTEAPSKNIDSLLETMENIVNAKVKKSTHKNKPRPPPQRPPKRYHCDICNRTLSNAYSFNYHMQRHTKYQFICEHCGRGFPGKVPLHRHLVRNHDSGPYIQCKLCPFKCSRTFDLNEHVRIHTGERPFTCEQCGLTFRRKAIWRNHLIQHQEKNVPCTICHKKFHRQSELSWHINSQHMRSYLFLCSICNASYASNKTVRKHLLSKHGIPREKQGKITRITNENNTLHMENKLMNGYGA